MRKKMILVLDTETAPINVNGGIRPSNMLVYDIGYRIIDKYNNCYLERNFLVNEIFHGEYEKMLTSYYANKLPLYYEMLANKEILLKDFNDIHKILMNDIKSYNVDTISCHNTSFDYGALCNTNKWINGKWLSFWPKSMTMWDSCKMARQTICKYKTYNYTTPSGKMKSATADNLGKYYYGDEFRESHTALDDARLESFILFKCLSSHKKCDKIYIAKW